MKFKGKVIGALIGLLILGPVGFLFGLISGHLYDLGYFDAFLQIVRGGAQHTTSQQIFFNNTFKIMGYIAKCDGRVSEKEIEIARVIMSKMGLNEPQKQEAMALFTQGKQSDFDLTHSIQQLKQVCHLQPALLYIFLDIQSQMASADGTITSAKQAILRDIAEQLGVQGYQRSYSHQRYSHAQQPSNTEDAYEILGIARNATPDEIKKAYRKLMSQNHPDKLIAKGLPPEMIKLATQKTQRIKQAYEQIKKT